MTVRKHINTELHRCRLVRRPFRVVGASHIKFPKKRIHEDEYDICCEKRGKGAEYLCFREDTRNTKRRKKTKRSNRLYWEM